VVIDLRQAQPAVLLRDLHAERTDPLEALDDRFRNSRVAFALKRIHVLGEEVAELRQERLAALYISGLERRLRVDQVELEMPEEEVLAERGKAPLGRPPPVTSHIS